MVPIYANLLTLFALGSARGSGTYEPSQILLSALLSAGLDVKAYRALIADVEELAGEGFGLDMVYWVLEIIEDFMRASIPAAEARETFLHGVLCVNAHWRFRCSADRRPEDAAVLNATTDWRGNASLGAGSLGKPRYPAGTRLVIVGDNGAAGHAQADARGRGTPLPQVHR